MRCEQALEHLSDYLEETVSPPMRVVLEAHFQECPSCHHELTTLRECLDLFHGLDPVEPPPDFRAKVLAKLDAHAGEPRATLWQTLFGAPAARFRAYAVAAVTLAILVAITVLPRTAFENAAVHLGFDWRVPRGFGSQPAADVFPGRPELAISSRDTSSPHTDSQVNLVIQVQPREDLKDARLIIYRQRGLLSLTPGIPVGYGGSVVWQGSIGAGELATVPLKLEARAPGVYTILASLEADGFGGRRCRAFIPVLSQPRRSEGGWITGYLSMDDLLAEAARRLDVVVAHDMVRQKPAPVSIQVTTPGRVISQICAQRGLGWSVSDGVYNIYEVDHR